MFDIYIHRYCLELQAMQTDATTQPFDHSILLLKQSLGEDILTRLHLDETRLQVIGNGCVAQVLYGQTADTRQHVAIKILHPHIRETIAVDIQLLSLFAGWVEDLVPGGHNWSVRDAVGEFSQLMNSQLDMTEEAHRLDKFRHNFDHYSCSCSANKQIHNRIVFPKPLWPYVTENILVESYEEGIQAGEVLSYNSGYSSPTSMILSPMQLAHAASSDSNNTRPHDKAGEDMLQVLGKNKSVIAELGLHTLLKMIFEDNFVHGDMHPGNLLLRYTPRPDKLHPLQGSESPQDFPRLELIVLDAGIVSELQDQDKVNLFDLFKGRSVFMFESLYVCYYLSLCISVYIYIYIYIYIMYVSVAIARNVGYEAAQLMIHRSAWNESQLRLSKDPLVLPSPSDPLATLRPLAPSPTTPASGGIVEPEVFCLEMKALVNEVHAHGLALGRISVGE